VGPDENIYSGKGKENMFIAFQYLKKCYGKERFDFPLRVEATAQI
jgi:hypothetical protein